MRLLHTSDWHLGRAIRGRSRIAEFDAVLHELTDLAAAEGVDVVLVAGDIFDTMSPPPEAERLLFSALRRLVERRIEVVLVAGNHDNPRRLAALGEIADLLGVHTQPLVRRWDEGGTIRLDRNGQRLNLAAVPWVPEGRALNATEILGPEFESYQQYAEFVTAIYAQASGGFDDGAINVFASHVFVDGARVAGHDGSERRIHIGQTYAVSAAALPGRAQYVALGHVHEPQQVLDAPNGTAVYAGSLVQLDFGECGQQKSVRIVDLDPGRPARVQAVPLTTGRQLVEVRGTYDEIVAGADQVQDAYVRATVRLIAPQPGLARQLRDLLPNCVDVRIESAGGLEDEPPVQTAALTPVEAYARYYEREHGSPPAPEMLTLFEDLLAEATAEQS